MENHYLIDKVVAFFNVDYSKATDIIEEYINKNKLDELLNLISLKKDFFINELQKMNYTKIQAEVLFLKYLNWGKLKDLKEYINIKQEIK